MTRVLIVGGGIDALRAIDADTPVLHAGFPTPTNLLYSSRGRRLGAVSNGGVLPHGTAAHTIKRARLYRTLYPQAAGGPAPCGRVPGGPPRPPAPSSIPPRQRPAMSAWSTSAATPRPAPAPPS